MRATPLVPAGTPPASPDPAPILAPVAPTARRLLRIERLLVLLVALHSVAVGAMLLLAPAWAVEFAGWAGADPLFFPRQGGAFHFVAAFAYVYEHRRLESVTILAFTKALAVVFLLSVAAAGEAAWSVPFSGLSDGLMGATVLAVHHWRLKLSRRGG